MIGSIRKHSKWLWAVIITATIVSFVFWGAAPATRGGAGGITGYGKIYGKTITKQDLSDARNEFRLYYFNHYGNWPEEKSSLTSQEIEQQTYIRLLMNRKAAQLGIQVSEDDVVTEANELLSSPSLIKAFHTSGKPVDMADFAKYILTPAGLTTDDFQRFIRNDIAIQQLERTYGAPGQLISPQEAGVFYDREHQEVSAQMVTFSGSNYLSQVTVTPAAVAEFYTNWQAEYRLPDRVQIKYVAFPVTNYLAQAKAELSTNLESQVSGIFNQYGVSGVPGAANEEDARKKIRDSLIHQRAGAEAKLQANDFESAISAVDASAVKPELLDQIAQKKGVSVDMTAPFGADYGPEEFFAPQELTKIAFELSPDEPISSPIAGTDAYYIIALVRQLPSVIPPLAQIQSQVTEDFQHQLASFYARQAGTNFIQYKLRVEESLGKSFAAAASSSGLNVEALPPFSISTQSLPGFEQRAEITRLKQAAFGTLPGHTSTFIATPEGGFVVHVDSMLPVDQAKKEAELPAFFAQLRQNRENEAFNQWFSGEANRELKNTAYARERMAQAGSAQSP